MVPVHDVATVSSIEFDSLRWEQLTPMAEGRLASAYVYCRGGVNHMARFHARKFGPGAGSLEDPATGSAVAALSGAIHYFDQFVDGHHPVLVEQGWKWDGRPSSTCISTSPAGRSPTPASAARR